MKKKEKRIKKKKRKIRKKEEEVGRAEIEKLNAAVISSPVGRRAAGFKQVWAVTILGKIAYRHGVSANSPEGTHWEIIPTRVRR